MKTSLVFSMLVGVICFISSCKKSDKPTPAATAPVIASISPDTGPKNTAVTITGNNFGTDISKVIVTFNGMVASVQTVTNTSIVAKVPVKANTGKVSVNINGQAADGPIFNYTLSYTVSTLAGSGALGHADGAAAGASFGFPTGIVLDKNGNMFVADQYYNLVREITLGASPTVSTFAGGFQSTVSYVDGTGAGAKFAFPTALYFDAQGNMIEGDVASPASLIRKITPAAVVTTISGVAGGQGSGYADGTLNTARFDGPVSICIDATGNIYVADNNNFVIRKISTTGTVSTLAGNHSSGYADGTGTAASFRSATGLAIDAQGNLYVADPGNSSIRKVTQAGVVTTYCGGGPNGAGIADGDISVARFLSPRNLFIDAESNMYISDVGSHRIRKITGSTVTTIAGTSQGFADGDGASAQFNYPNGITVDALGNIYVADGSNYRIRKIVKE